MRLRLIPLLFIMLTCETMAIADDRPVLTVWTTVPPAGSDRSRCEMCDRFWADVEADPAFRAAIAARYRVRWEDVDRLGIVVTTLHGIHQVPTFTTPTRRIVLYTTPDDLLARLGLPPLKRERPAPPAEQTPAASAAQPAPQQQPNAEYVDDLNAWTDRIEQQVHQRDQAIGGRMEDQDRRIEELNRKLDTLQQGQTAQPAGSGVTNLTGPPPPGPPPADHGQAEGSPEDEAAAAAAAVREQGESDTESNTGTGSSDGDRQRAGRGQPGVPFDLPGLVGWIAQPLVLATGGPIAGFAFAGLLGLWRRRRQRRAAERAAGGQAGSLREDVDAVLGRIGQPRQNGGQADAGLPPAGQPAAHEASETSSDDDRPIIPPRATEELHQILQLRQVEGRDPLLDAAFGVFAQDEIDEALGAEGTGECERETLYQLQRRVRDRVDRAAPLMVTAEE